MFINKIRIYYLNCEVWLIQADLLTWLLMIAFILESQGNIVSHFIINLEDGKPHVFVILADYSELYLCIGQMGRDGKTGQILSQK